MHKQFTIPMNRDKFYDLRFTICKNVIILLLLLFSATKLNAQVNLGGEENTIDYSNPKEYTIGGITVSGIKYLDENVLKTLSGLSVGDKIKVPGEKISKAIENLWKQNLLADVKIEYTKIEGENIFLNIAMTELPRLSKFSFTGVTKSEANKLREKINLVSGKIVNENLVKVTTYEVKEFFTDKGYLNAEVKIDVINDSIPPNSQTLVINVKENKKTKIHAIKIEGNTVFKDAKLRRNMKDTKKYQWWNITRSSKFIEENFVKDKQRIVDKYTENGYRDAKIAFDTVYVYNRKRVNVEMRIDEGHKFYFRTITWTGNTKYRSGQLDTLLGIRKGDVYNQKRLDEGLNMSSNGRDVTSLYMDDGYLFFQINPVEIKVENDSIDIEMRMYEGKQAVINKVSVSGNTKTNDKVILREIRTKPGQLFSRADIIRTQRELSQLGYFDPEKLGVNPKPNATDGTVDIDYVVEEKPSDQIELSGGWGAGQVVGTLGVSFNNFSARNIFRKGNWTPLPSGDGQKLSLRFQTNGVYYQSYNASFTEPWLGGKKPNSLSVSLFRSVQTNGQSASSESRQSISINGVSVGLGKRLQWPDDFFSIYYEASYQYYALNHYATTFLFSDGYSNNLNFQISLSRNSVNQPIYPTGGTSFAFTIQATPPYSLFSKTDYTTATDKVKYKFIEYHKWKFTSSWFTPLVGKKFILASKASFGFLGYYNKDIGQSPFERFYLGGDGLSGFSLDGREIIAHRGYGNQALTPSNYGATIYDKFTMEFRYPVSLNPNATIYVMGFLEGGNSWIKFSDYNPFVVKKAAGLGVRIFLPMFGLLGLDYGWPFDRSYQDDLNVKHGSPQFQFTLGQQF